MKKILIIQTAFLGDVVLATPVIEQARILWPKAEIDFLLRKGNESLLEGHPHLRQVIIRNKAEGKWKSLRKVLKAVRGEQYDLVINLHRFLSSGLIAGFSKGKVICGFDKNPLSWRYHHKRPHIISETDPGVHEVERNLSLIEPFGKGEQLQRSEKVGQDGGDTAHSEVFGEARMRLYPSKSDFEKVACKEPYVCIAPTSVWYSKQWPAEKWIQLIQALDPELKIFLLGAPSDRKACEAIAQKAQHTTVSQNLGRETPNQANLPRIENKAGELSLLQSAALMKAAKMNYVNDSAPMHLASAMDAPVTAVFLSTVPRFGFGPRSSQSHIAETPEKLECRPCGLHA